MADVFRVTVPATYEMRGEVFEGEEVVHFTADGPAEHLPDLRDHDPAAIVVELLSD